MHRIKVILIFSLSVSCGTPAHKQKLTEAPVESFSRMQKTFVESVELDRSYQSENEIKFIIRGQLPSPAYKLDDVDVAVKENQIFLTPYAYFQPKFSALQVLIPFQTSVTIILATPGEYQIHLIGRASTLQKNIIYN